MNKLISNFGHFSMNEEDIKKIQEIVKKVPAGIPLLKSIIVEGSFIYIACFNNKLKLFLRGLEVL